MSVDLAEVFAASQASTVDGMGKMFALSADLQRGVFTKKVDEIDQGQAIAMKEASKSGAHTDPRLPTQALDRG